MPKTQEREAAPDEAPLPVDTRRFRFVEVEWEDAVSEHRWCGPEDLPRPPRIITRGWLVREDLDHIVLAGTISDGEGFGEVLALPMGMVQGLRALEV